MKPYNRNSRSTYRGANEPAGDGLRGPRMLTYGCFLIIASWAAFALIVGAIWAAYVLGAAR